MSPRARPKRPHATKSAARARTRAASRGRAAQLPKDPSRYIDLLRAALAVRPRDPDLLAQIQQALEWRETERYREIEERVQKDERRVLDLEAALRAGRDAAAELVDVLVRVGDGHLSAGRGCCAASRFARALTLAPGHLEALHGLARAHWLQEKFAPTERVLTELVARDPGRAEAHALLAWCHYRLLRFEEARAAADRALALDRRNLTALRAIINVHIGSGEMDRAGALIARARKLAPASADLDLQDAFRRLTIGDFARGWELYEARFSDGPGEMPEPQFPQPRWDGSDLTGKTILIDPEQGAGDVIQMVRFLRRLKDRGATVMLPVSCDLTNLMRTCDGADLVIDPMAMPGMPFDCWLPLGSLPLMLGIRMRDLPANTGYLRADPQAVRRWTERLDAVTRRGAWRVGLCWAGNAAMLDDNNRSFDPARYLPLAGLRGVEYVSLQVGRRASPEVARRLNLIDFTGELVDFADTAALMSSLDLVLSVDTSVAHLAGALALPAWTLVRSTGDYRWLLGRGDSPWYPTMRLFRQPAPLAWDPAIAEVRAALVAVCRESRASGRPLGEVAKASIPAPPRARR